MSHDDVPDEGLECVPDDAPARASDVPDGGDGVSGDFPDPVAAELSAVFAAALADEPASAVTPLTVLHAVRDGRRGREDSRWRREWAVWKWGGGLLAAAAVVAAVLILGPLLFSHGTQSTTAGGASSSTAEGVPFAASQGTMAGPAAGADAPPQLAAAPTGTTDQGAAGQAGGGVAGLAPQSGAPNAPGPASIACAAPSLTESEWGAAIAALPENVVISERFAAGCRTEATRAGTLGIDSLHAIEILIGPLDAYPSGLQPSLGDQRLGPTATASDGATIVVVTASANSVTLVDRAKLTAIATAVLAAVG